MQFELEKRRDFKRAIRAFAKIQVTQERVKLDELERTLREAFPK